MRTNEGLHNENLSGVKSVKRRAYFVPNSTDEQAEIEGMRAWNSNMSEMRL